MTTPDTLYETLSQDWQKLRRTLLAPGQLYGSPTGEYQDRCRMLRRVTLTNLYRRAVVCHFGGQKTSIRINLHESNIYTGKS